MVDARTGRVHPTQRVGGRPRGRQRTGPEVPHKQDVGPWQHVYQLVLGRVADIGELLDARHTWRASGVTRMVVQYDDGRGFT
jgi:hypothetical protein